MERNSYKLWGYLLAIFILSPTAAYAYVDVGSGSIVVQVAISGVLGLLFWVKSYWARIVQIAKRVFDNKH
jgi:hypothetical protein